MCITPEIHCFECNSFEINHCEKSGSEILTFKVAVQACDHETTRHTKAYLIQTRSTDGNKLYIK